MITYVHYYFPTTATCTVGNILSFIGLKEKSGYFECCYTKKAKNGEQCLTKNPASHCSSWATDCKWLNSAVNYRRLEVSFCPVNPKVRL